MTLLYVIAIVAASNPPRRREALSVDDTRIVTLGAAMTAVFLVVAAILATPLLDALDTSAPNLRIGVGLVVAAVGLHDLVRRRPQAGAALDGGRAALVPVFFPVLARPEVALLALSAGADHGVGFAAGISLLALATVVGWHALARHVTSGPFARVEGALARALAAVSVVAGVLITSNGVFSI